MQIETTGHPLHTRSLTIVGSQAAKGRWQVRGDIVDLRKRGFVPMSNDLQPAGIIHHMTILLGVDALARRIDSLATEQPSVAIEASERTGGECCRDPAPRLLELRGETLNAEFPRRLTSVFGGPLGCSHLLTLFHLMASSIPRALERERELGHRGGGPDRSSGERIFWCSAFVDGLEATDGSVELALQLAEYHTRALASTTTPMERLAREEVVRGFARVEMPGLVVRELRAAERSRSAERLDPDWTDRSPELAGVVGAPIIPGLARRLFAVLGDDPVESLALAALLQLAPGHLQVMAAVTDRWFATASASAPDKDLPRDGVERLGASLGGATALGGIPDSCYMWRTGGSLQTLRGAAPAAASISSERE